MFALEEVCAGVFPEIEVCKNNSQRLATSGILSVFLRYCRSSRVKVSTELWDINMSRMAESKIIGWKQLWHGGWEQKHPMINQQMIMPSVGCCNTINKNEKWWVSEKTPPSTHWETEQVTPGTFLFASSIAQPQCIISADVMPFCSSGTTKSKRGAKQARKQEQKTRAEGWDDTTDFTPKETDAIIGTWRTWEGRCKCYCLPFSPPPPKELTVHSNNKYSSMHFVGEKAWRITPNSPQRKCIHV